MKSTIKRIVFLCVCLFFCCSGIKAAELLVVTEEWRPYNYSEGGEIKGTATEIVKKVLHRAGIDYTIKVYPWARAYHMGQTLENCLLYTVIRIAPRENLFKWVRPLGQGGTTCLYRLKGKDKIVLNSIDDAKEYMIVTNRDSMDHLWFESNGFTKLYLTPTIERTIHLFLRGRVDFISFDNRSIKHEFENLGLDPGQAVLVLPVFQMPYYMALSPSTSDIILETLQKAYDELLAERRITLFE